MVQIITLTTDFGVSSPYVAAMKGVMLSMNPQLQIVDISHSIPPQQIAIAAMALADTALLFPAGTIHVAVVDPGVGTSRRIIYAEIEPHRFICPDNGLLDRLAERQAPTKIIQITEQQYFRHPVAPTFHGRDIMAPVAAHLSLGLDPQRLGSPHPKLKNLDWPGATRVANRIEGQVVAVDSFGNLITNITREMLVGVPTDESVTVRCDEHETHSIFTTYAEQPPMTLVALIGSNDQLEIAIVEDSAKIMLGVGVGAPVEIVW
ncbi:MAG: SAM-dependent chlorinase/fluorinase [Bythopirellula sp.]|nr:SAM-dependent chlorinase/fluorinase [Bythopirellula sp.]